jgi:hypothetical protein
MDVKKIIAKLPTGFAEDAAGMNGDQLRAEIIKAETSLRTVDQEMKALSSAYNEAKKAQRAKIAYALHVLEERGELGTGAHAPDEA